MSKSVSGFLKRKKKFFCPLSRVQLQYKFSYRNSKTRNIALQYLANKRMKYGGPAISHPQTIWGNRGILYRVMQSDGNSRKIKNFKEI